jgi:hypothetical protein
MVPGCLPLPNVAAVGCADKDMHGHDDKAECLYFCIEHCAYHDGSRGKLRK